MHIVAKKKLASFLILVNAGVTFPLSRHYFSITSDVQTCLATEGPTGRVKGAWLTISAIRRNALHQRVAKRLQEIYSFYRCHRENNSALLQWSSHGDLSYS